MMPAAFKRILVATDFNDPASSALEVGLSLAAQSDGELILLHVHYVPRIVFEPEAALRNDESETRARRMLDAAIARAKQRHPKCGSVLKVGAPAECIVATAKECGADLIVVGTHGRRGLTQALLGSVAERVLRTAPVPVLTVGGADRDRTARASALSA